MDGDMLVKLALSLAPLLMLLAVLALIMRLRLFERMGERIADRRLGKGQGALLRRASREGVIPPGADVSRWRAELTESELVAPRRGFGSIAFLVLLSLLLIVAGVVSDTVQGVIGNLVPALVILGITAYLLSYSRAQARERERLVRLLDLGD